MENAKIVIITASEVKNLELAERFKTSFEALNAKASVINLVELDLPLYTSRTDALFKGEELLREQLPTIREANGFVFIAPEYNGSTPPIFNNFLAWLSRSSKDWREFLNGKTATLATFSGGGGFNVLLAMRTQLSFIGMNVLGRQAQGHFSKAVEDKTIEGMASELIKNCHP